MATFEAVTLRKVTSTIPIVCPALGDAVHLGLIANEARPGGNVTGITNFEFTIGGKWLETLKEIFPRVVRVAVLYNPMTAPYAGSLLRFIASAAPNGSSIRNM